MPRSNKQIDNEPEAMQYNKLNDPTFNVRSRRKSNSNNMKKSKFFRNRTRINGAMSSSDSESSTDSSNVSAIKPSNNSNNDNNNDILINNEQEAVLEPDMNSIASIASTVGYNEYNADNDNHCYSGSYIPRRSKSQHKIKQNKKNKTNKQHKSKQFGSCSLSGRKRKRSEEYHSDFDNISMFNRNNNGIDYNDNNNNNNGINIHYELPAPQRQQILGYNQYNVGDDIYLIFQEYFKKYQETLAVINRMHKLSEITDDIMMIEHFCQNTGYLDGKIIGFYKPSSMYLQRVYNNSIDIDLGVLRNWRMILIEIANTNKQIIIHDIHDNNGQSHLSQYILSDLEFLESIEMFERGDIVTMKCCHDHNDENENKCQCNKGYGRILEIAAIDENKYKLSPYKCLSIIGLNDCNKMDITCNGQRYYRCSPWEVNKLHNINISNSFNVDNDNNDNNDDEVTEKKQMVNFIESELIAFLPCRASSFSLYFKKFEDIIQDIGNIFDPSNRCLNLERTLYSIKREISYKYLCLDEETKRDYNSTFISIIERIITLSVPIQQEKMIHSVKTLAFPQINHYDYHY